MASTRLRAVTSSSACAPSHSKYAVLFPYTSLCTLRPTGSGVNLEHMPRAALPREEARGKACQTVGDGDRPFIHVTRPVDQIVSPATDLFLKLTDVQHYGCCISPWQDVQCPAVLRPMKGSSIYLIFLGLVVAAIGGLFTLLMWDSYQRAVDQRNWPQVEAVVLSSEVREFQHDEFSPKEYRVEILYGYEWESEAMTSDRLTARGNPTSKDRAKIQGQSNAFLAGAKVIAYVNPENPDFTILKPDSKAAGYSIWFPLLFVVGGLGIVVKTLLSVFRPARP